MIKLGIALALLFVASVAHAQPVTLIALDGPLDTAIPTLVEKFADETIKLDATFFLGTTDDGKIYGNLTLNGGELGTPLQANIPFVADDVQAGPVLRRGTFSLVLAATTKPVDLELDLWLQTTDGPSIALGKVPLRVYPRDYFKNDIVKFFTDSPDETLPHGQLALFGDADGLRQLFDQWKVDYKELHSAIPLTIDTGLFAIGLSTHKPDPLVIPQLSSDSSLLWFCPEPEKFPGVYQTASPKNVTSLVNFVPPENWSDSPFFQRLLLEHIQQTIQLHHLHEN